MKSRTVIKNALKRKRSRQRGLQIIIPNNDLSESHITKANHNLQVMDDLDKLEHTDWVVIVAYYAMYHAATSILAQIGLESKDHATTVAILEYFFSEHLDKNLLQKFNDLKAKKDAVEQLYLKDEFLDYLWRAKILRESAQYGTKTLIPEYKETLNHSKDFVQEIRILKNKITEDHIKIIQETIKEIDNKIIQK